MAEVKWIKICTDIFDDEKILLIENMPEADSIIVMWFKLLCMAGKQNNSGVFVLNDKIAYTDEMLSTVFCRPLNIVRLALKTFEAYGMIEIIDNVITIPKWEKHQSLRELERKKELNRKRVAAYREKQKLLASGNSESNDCVMRTSITCNATERDKEKEKERDNNLSLFGGGSMSSILQKNKCEQQTTTLTTTTLRGKNGNVGITDEQYDELKAKYGYADKVIDALSEYKFRKGVAATTHDFQIIKDWAEKDKGMYENNQDSFDTDDFFEAAIRRSYGRKEIDNEIHRT